MFKTLLSITNFQLAQSYTDLLIASGDQTVYYYICFLHLMLGVGR
jgi:hypothetical protein